MNLYNCIVSLSGNILNQVPKREISPAEISVLRVLHGDDAVVSINKVRSTKRSHAVERGKLEGVYGKPVVASLFGPAIAGAKLPVELVAVADEEEEVPFEVTE